MSEKPTETRTLNPVEEIQHNLSRMEAQFKAALPPQVTPEKFMRVVLTAVQRNPELLAPDVIRRTLYSACLLAAQDGLLPDNREAALTINNVKVKGPNGDSWEKHVRYMPMVGGILKKVRNSGELASLTSNVVYAGDTFDYWVDDEGEHLTHRPLLEGDRGAFRLVYAIAKTKDGSPYMEIMTKDQVDQVRKSAAAGSTAWRDWYPEQARKSAIRRLSKRLPMSTDLEKVIERDDDLYSFEQQRLAAAPAPVASLPSQRPAPLQAVLDHGARSPDPKTAAVHEAMADRIAPAPATSPAAAPAPAAESEPADLI